MSESAWPREFDKAAKDVGGRLLLQEVERVARIGI